MKAQSHLKGRILDGYQIQFPRHNATRVSITARYGVRVFAASGDILSQMTENRADYYANVACHARR